MARPDSRRHARSIGAGRFIRATAPVAATGIRSSRRASAARVFSILEEAAPKFDYIRCDDASEIRSARNLAATTSTRAWPSSVKAPPFGRFTRGPSRAYGGRTSRGTRRSSIRERARSESCSLAGRHATGGPALFFGVLSARRRARRRGGRQRLGDDTRYARFRVCSVTRGCTSRILLHIRHYPAAGGGGRTSSIRVEVARFRRTSGVGLGFQEFRDTWATSFRISDISTIFRTARSIFDCSSKI